MLGKRAGCGRRPNGGWLAVAVGCGLSAAAGCGGGSGLPSAPTVDTSKDSSCDLQFAPAATSEYVLPFHVGSTYTIIQTYCEPNPNWGHHGDYAYDFDLPIGTDVLASRDGTVFLVREQYFDGMPEHANMIMVEHADGTVMQYVHLTHDGALVEVGDSVTTGQVIGLSGNSGPSNGPHLHIELFMSRNNFDGRTSLPVSYRNADGPLDANGGLVRGASYTALPY